MKLGQTKQDIKVGDTFFWLTVIDDIGLFSRKSERPSPKRDRKVRCLCKCGKIKDIIVASLRRGLSKSCGCYSQYVLDQNRITHNLSKHPLYTVWSSMKKRCYNQKCKNYHNYGGRGINVCDEWLNDFKSFHDWSNANGWKRGLQLDRANNNAGYSPSNCRYVTPIVNGNNKRDTRNIEWNGQIKTLRGWSQFTGLSFKLLECRLQNNKHWTIDRIFTEPSRGGRYKRHDANLNRHVAVKYY